MYTPTDDELDACPYDYPCHWIARALDANLADEYPVNRSQAASTDTHGRFDNVVTSAFSLAVTSYAKAVLDSDPVDDKGDVALAKYTKQHVVTPMQAPRGEPGSVWDQRTFDQGTVVLALANGPFYAVALVMRGDGLHLVSLGSAAASVRVR